MLYRYTTLCCLAFKDTFKAGCSAYGIGDLEMLASDTHKSPFPPPPPLVLSGHAASLTPY